MRNVKISFQEIYALPYTTTRASDAGRTGNSLMTSKYDYLDKTEGKFLDECQRSHFTSVKYVPNERKSTSLPLFDWYKSFKNLSK